MLLACRRHPLPEKLDDLAVCFIFVTRDDRARCHHEIRSVCSTCRCCLGRLSSCCAFMLMDACSIEPSSAAHIWGGSYHTSGEADVHAAPVIVTDGRMMSTRFLCFESIPRQMLASEEQSRLGVGVILMEYCSDGHLLQSLQRLAGTRMAEVVILSIFSDIVG